MDSRVFITAVVLVGGLSIFVALYLQWAVQKWTAYRPDYFMCYWLALIGCLANLFLPFGYRMIMAPYRPLSHGVEWTILNMGGFFISFFLYFFFLKGPQGRLLSWLQAGMITIGQYLVFLILSAWIK